MSTFQSTRWPALAELLDGKVDDALAPFILKKIEDEDLPVHLATSSTAFKAMGKKDAAKAIAYAARALAPDDIRVKYRTTWLDRHAAPMWHFPMMNDGVRNDIYDRALKANVKPGMKVFEIGTGSGLLAMMAVRAGADHVYTCERRDDVAKAARAVIAQNGMADKITVISKSAEQVVLGEDMPARCDLFVAEIVDNGLLTEDVLPLTELARRKFLKEDAILLPRFVAAHGALFENSGQAIHYRIEEAAGFDLTPFNALSPATTTLHRDQLDVAYLSDSTEVLGFDLAIDAPKKDAHQLSITANKDGRVEGLITWLYLDFGEGMTFDNMPPKWSVWQPCLHLLPKPREVKAGDKLTFDIEHDYRRFYVIPS